MSNYYIPYEWYALLLMVLGDWQEVRKFEDVLKEAFRCANDGTKMKSAVILWGPAGSGKSTILNLLQMVLEKGIRNKIAYNVVFAHDWDFMKAPNTENIEWQYIMKHPVIFAASNHLINEEYYPYWNYIFATTGQRFEPEVYEAIVKVCEDHAEDIYKYYAEEEN